MVLFINTIDQRAILENRCFIPESELSTEVETVRCIIENSLGQILLLQKDQTSRSPSLFEFPGGKIEDLSSQHPTVEQQQKAAKYETLEETGLDLPIESFQRLGEFQYNFLLEGKALRRRVHVLYVNLSENNVTIVVNQTLNDQSESEDKHIGFIWVEKFERRELDEQKRLSGNSRTEGYLGNFWSDESR